MIYLHDHGTMTIVMYTVSKSQLKGKLLEYLRKVEQEKVPLIITHGGKPVVTVTPYKKEGEDLLKSLRKTVIFYKNPTDPVGEEDWEGLK